MIVETSMSQCRVGIARCDITPPVGIYHRMWGAASHDRATGIHRPLTATALFLQNWDGASSIESEQLVLALDHCLFWAREMDQILDFLATHAGINKSQILVAFSHTHAAGLMDLGRIDLPGGNLIAGCLNELASRLLAIVQQAHAHLQRASITYVTGQCALAAERDFWDEESRQFVCSFNPSGSADNTLLVARITDDTNTTLATVVNYACHPTTLAWQNTLISPDYPGAMRDLVEQATGSPCLFLQGASGDLGPKEGFVGDPAVADRNGRQLGYAVLATLEGMPPAKNSFAYLGPVLSGATLGSWEYRVITAERNQETKLWRLRRWCVELAYREGLKRTEELQAEREKWLTEESQAVAHGDIQKSRDCRAMVERLTRWQTRVAGLPAGSTFPFPITLLQMGDAFWVFVEGEHYQILQRALRARFPGSPILVTTLANGSRISYLVPRENYGKGIYQESIAVLAAGALELVIQEIGDEIERWQR